MQENDIVEKLNNIVLRIRDFPDFFKVCVQNNNDVAGYFLSQFNCKGLPDEFISFMTVLDGLHTELFTVFSISDEGSSVSLKFDEYSNKQATNNYLKNISTKLNLFFFACDNSGGRYAFNADGKDDKVYYINSNKPDVVVIHNSFFALLNDKINLYISKKI